MFKFVCEDKNVAVDVWHLHMKVKLFLFFFLSLFVFWFSNENVCLPQALVWFALQDTSEVFALAFGSLATVCSLQKKQVCWMFAIVCNKRVLERLLLIACLFWIKHSDARTIKRKEKKGVEIVLKVD